MCRCCWCVCIFGGAHERTPLTSGQSTQWHCPLISYILIGHIRSVDGHKVVVVVAAADPGEWHTYLPIVFTVFAYLHRLIVAEAAQTCRRLSGRSPACNGLRSHFTVLLLCLCRVSHMSEASQVPKPTGKWRIWPIQYGPFPIAISRLLFSQRSTTHNITLYS